MAIFYDFDNLKTTNGNLNNDNMQGWKITSAFYVKNI
jgi:hypothetical protein